MRALRGLGEGQSVPDWVTELTSDSKPFRRILVPLRSIGASLNALSLATRIGHEGGGILRLVHIHRYVSPNSGDDQSAPTRISEDATKALSTATSYAWARGVEASGVTVDAKRSHVAAAVIAEASGWGADVIVLPACPRRFTGLRWDKATRHVVRSSPCPVLVVWEDPA